MTRLRVVALVLLLVIGAQASLPLRAALERPSGAAWSAGTSDVALFQARKPGTEQQVAELATSTPLPGSPIPAGKPESAPAVGTGHLWPEARGPPPRAASSRPPDSTAPPRA